MAWVDENAFPWLAFLFSVGLRLATVDTDVVKALILACVKDLEVVTHSLIPLLLKKCPLTSTITAKIESLLRATQVDHDTTETLGTTGAIQSTFSLEQMESLTAQVCKRKLLTSSNPCANSVEKKWRLCSDPRWRNTSLGEAPPLMPVAKRLQKYGDVPVGVPVAMDIGSISTDMNAPSLIPVIFESIQNRNVVLNLDARNAIMVDRPAPMRLEIF